MGGALSVNENKGPWRVTLAKMIPPKISFDTPVGEAILFEKLRDDPGTNGWVVLHSLDLRKHLTKTEGEIDMVIIAPGLGVLCIEVKGCDVSRRDGLWVYPYGESVEGPFKQAARGMHSLRDHVSKREPSMSGLMFWSAVVFTRIQFNQVSPEWHSSQVIDRLILGRSPISQIITRVMEHAHKHLGSVSKNSSWYDNQKSRPTTDHVKRLTGILRGNFELVVQPRSDIQRIEESILRLTEDQYEALDSVEENPRVVIKGLAGTGKTLLAMEAARRAVSDGKNVLLLCYNRLLGDWLKVFSEKLETKAGDGALSSYTFHGLLTELVGRDCKNKVDHIFWRFNLPALAIEELLSDQKVISQYDLLLLDEAQDIMTDEYLDVLDLLLKGGLAGGQWVFFGDFERQAIYTMVGGENASDMLNRIKSRSPNHANFNLKVNCRNAAPIAETLTLACNVYPGYKRFLNDMEGASVDPIFWSSNEDQLSKLETSISELRSLFNSNEIVILSLNADDRSCASYSKKGFIPIREIGGTNIGVRYSSVHAFKGLESSAIIVTDITKMDEYSRALLYVAMSRARIRLVLLMHESCRKVYDHLLEIGLYQGLRG